MIEVVGQYNTAICYTGELEAAAAGQIQAVCDQPAFADSKIRIMPDVHAGMGCTIGTTMTVTDKIVPGMVGVDIGCGMETVALSLGIYFAERNKGEFHNHFITFSESPRLVEIKGQTVLDKLRYCESFNEVANTDIQRVFELVLEAAVKNGLPQEEMPEKLYIISDMEFDQCAVEADMTNFEYAKERFAEAGYRLPQVVFWNVQSRNRQQPVTQNEQGVALVSGCSPRIFSMLQSGSLTPMGYMLQILGAERYEMIAA